MIVQVMLTLFAIVVVGYLAGKKEYMGGTFDKRLSKLVIDITCPALILSSAMTGELPDRAYILPLLGISALTYVLLTGVAITLPRLLTKQKSEEGLVGFALMFGNVGFMGYPIVASIFGREAVFYAAVLNVVNTFAVFTIGTMLITGKNEVQGPRFQKKVLWSTPMSQLPLRAMLGNATIYATTLMRLAILPIGIHFLFTWLGFDPFVVGINTVVIAMPVATYGTILCLRHGKDTTLITEVTFITTLLSMLTIPLLVMSLLKF